MYLHTDTEFDPSPAADATQVFFDILSAQSSFNVQKRDYQGMAVGGEIGGRVGVGWGRRADPIPV